MKKKIGNWLLVFTVLLCSGSGYSGEDKIFVGRLSISKSATKIIYDVTMPGESVETITSKDKIIFYEAIIVALNPQKKKYEIEINCLDSEGRLVFKGIAKRKFKIEDRVGSDTVMRLVQQLGMDPKKGAMIEGQLMPLKSDSDYFFKIYVDHKLLGISRFHYLIL